MVVYESALVVCFYATLAESAIIVVDAIYEILMPTPLLFNTPGQYSSLFIFAICLYLTIYMPLRLFNHHFTDNESLLFSHALRR